MGSARPGRQADRTMVRTDMRIGRPSTTAFKKSFCSVLAPSLIRTAAYRVPSRVIWGKDSYWDPRYVQTGTGLVEAARRHRQVLSSSSFAATTGLHCRLRYCGNGTVVVPAYACLRTPSANEQNCNIRSTPLMNRQHVTHPKP